MGCLQSKAFNQPLNKWNVSNVKDMIGMFYSAESFNQPLDNWDVGNVTNCCYMFAYASSFNQPLNKWDVSNVRNMTDMFACAKAFNQPLPSWNIINVRNMNNIFNNSNFNHVFSTPDAIERVPLKQNCEFLVLKHAEVNVDGNVDVNYVCNVG